MGKSQDNADRLVNRIPSNKNQNVLEGLSTNNVLIVDYEQLLKDPYLTCRVARLMKSWRQPFQELDDKLDPRMEHGFTPETFSVLYSMGFRKYFELFTLSGEDLHTLTVAEEVKAFYWSKGRIFPETRAEWIHYMRCVYREFISEERKRAFVDLPYFLPHYKALNALAENEHPLQTCFAIEDIGKALEDKTFSTWPRERVVDTACAAMLAFRLLDY